MSTAAAPAIPAADLDDWVVECEECGFQTVRSEIAGSGWHYRDYTDCSCDPLCADHADLADCEGYYGWRMSGGGQW